MMFTRTAQHLARYAAFLVALLCLWCSSVGTLHHTDDFSAGLTFAAGQNSLGQAHPVSALDACAAHQWEQTVPTLWVPVRPVAAPSFLQTRFSASLPQTLHSLLPDYTALRGPPSPSLHA